MCHLPFPATLGDTMTFPWQQPDKCRDGGNKLHSFFFFLNCLGVSAGAGLWGHPLALEKQQMAKLPKQRLNHLGGLIRAGAGVAAAPARSRALIPTLSKCRFGAESWSSEQAAGLLWLYRAQFKL